MFLQMIQNFEREIKPLLNQETLHIVNGQEMLGLIRKNQRLAHTTVIPFNEAMCTHPTTCPIFSQKFIKERAKGHHSTVEEYEEIVLRPLGPLFEESFQSIVLWFGEDVFCQMNLLTLLAYIEQENRKEKVFLVTFIEPDYHGIRMERIELGDFQEAYQTVLVEKGKETATSLPLLNKRTEDFLILQQAQNPVTNWLEKHKDLPEETLIQHLIQQFPEYGYGDSQYRDWIRDVKNS